MAIAYQNFDALIVGATSVPGWDSYFGGGVVTADGVKLGINGNAGHAFRITEGALGFSNFPSPIGAVTAWFNWKHTAPFASAKMLSFQLWDGITLGNSVEFGYMFMEGDYSLSIYAQGTRGIYGNGLMDNTGLAIHPAGFTLQQRADQRWGIFFQVECDLASVVIGGVLFVQVSLTVWADGEQILTGTLATQQIVGSGAGGFVVPKCNNVLFIAGGILNSAEIDEVTIDPPPGGAPNYPTPGTPKARVTQGVIETNILPSTAQVRATQGVIETNILPSTANIRITQAVIELLLGTPQSGGPEYIKRRLPGSS